MAVDADEPTEASVATSGDKTEPIPVATENTSVVPVTAEADVPTEVPAIASRWRGVQQLSRSYIPQPIPLEGTDSQTNSQPHLLEDIRLAYIFQAPMIRGKFDSQKAKQLGVPNGPIRGKLTAGQAIEIDDPENPGQKKTIKPEDVVGAPQDGGVSNLPSTAIPSRLTDLATGCHRY
jgi:ribonuclease Z